MPNTEVYKIPGAFNPPPVGWPKMEFPNLAKGLLEEWVAEDLPEGVFPSEGWVSRAGSMKLIPTPNYVPDVVVDAKGQKAVKFSRGQIRNSGSMSWRGEMTYEIAFNPVAGQTGGGRIFSGSSGNFRGMYLYTSNISATTSQSANPNASTTSLGGFIPGQMVYAVARYGSTQVVGKTMGRPLSSTLPVSGETVQTQFIMGANSSTPPSDTTFFDALVYRIRVWNRALTEFEMDAAMIESSAIYGL